MNSSCWAVKLLVMMMQHWIYSQHSTIKHQYLFAGGYLIFKTVVSSFIVFGISTCCYRCQKEWYIYFITRTEKAIYKSLILINEILFPLHVIPISTTRCSQSSSVLLRVSQVSACHISSYSKKQTNVSNKYIHLWIFR